MYIEFIGYALSLFIAIVIGFITIKNPREDKSSWAITITSFLVGVMITSHINMKCDLKLITSQQFISKIKANEDAKNLATACFEAKPEIDNLKSYFFHYLYNRKLKRTTINFESLNDLEIKYNVSEFDELGELQADVIEIFKGVSNYSKIRATSYVAIDQWWTGLFGEKYSQENINALDRGVEIERIFIFPDEEEFRKVENQDLMKEQKESGIKVYYVMFDEIEQYIDDKIDIILVDAEFCGVLHLIERKMKRVEFSANKEKVKELNIYWINIQSVAKEY